MRALTGLALWFSIVAAAPAAGTEIRMSYPALDRALVTGLLQQGRRLYFEGGPEETCRYAFVQEPRTRADSGRLVIRFLFSGRAGASLKGRCVGPGDTFPLEVSGVPVESAGELRLDDLRVEAPDTVYFRLVSGLVRRRLQDQLRFPLRAIVETALARAGASLGTAVTLEHFGVRAVSAEAEALRLDLDLDLALR